MRQGSPKEQKEARGASHLDGRRSLWPALSSLPEKLEKKKKRKTDRNKCMYVLYGLVGRVEY